MTDDYIPGARGLIAAMHRDIKVRMAATEVDAETGNLTIYLEDGTAYNVLLDEVEKLKEYLGNRLDRVKARKRNLNEQEEQNNKEIAALRSSEDEDGFYDAM